ncbi:hypothetical protein niasHT_026355 [Heterodera trifolii]|uniref:Uncharacterized protein n=1 Tax=Heterodera trifolii TaxID=157864 RepID=A0ABD2KQI4_9BILA
MHQQQPQSGKTGKASFFIPVGHRRQAKPSSLFLDTILQHNNGPSDKRWNAGSCCCWREAAAKRWTSDWSAFDSDAISETYGRVPAADDYDDFEGRRSSNCTDRDSVSETYGGVPAAEDGYAISERADEAQSADALLDDEARSDQYSANGFDGAEKA